MHLEFSLSWKLLEYLINTLGLNINIIKRPEQKLSLTPLSPIHIVPIPTALLVMSVPIAMYT